MRWVMIDLQVFREASIAAFEGRSVYDAGFTTARLPFLYPPFALIVLWPIAAVPLEAAKLGMTMLSLAALGLMATRAAASAAISMRWAHPLAVGAAGVFILSEPMQQNLQMGQVNVIIAALAFVDFLMPRSSRWKGLLIGMLAGVKLTPALFGLYYLLTGQRRAALNAAGSFAASVMVSGLLFPGSTAAYWSSVIFESRIGPAHLGNQSLLGVLERATQGGGDNHHLVVTVWIVGCVVILVSAMRWLIRGGERVEASVAFGILSLTILLVSPLSWTPHWISVVPLVVGTVSKQADLRSALATLLTVGLVLFVWQVDGVWSGLIWFVYPSGFLAAGAPWWHVVAYFTVGALYTILGVGALVLLRRPHLMCRTPGWIRPLGGEPRA